MLSESDRPLIYAGGGVINANATKAMRRLANEYGIPVTTTLMALGRQRYDTSARAAHAGHARRRVRQLRR